MAKLSVLSKIAFNFYFLGHFRDECKKLSVRVSFMIDARDQLNFISKVKCIIPTLKAPH